MLSEKAADRMRALNFRLWDASETSASRDFWFETLLGALAYGGMLWLSRALFRDQTGAVAVAPASAVALAMVLRQSKGRWPTVLAACFLVNNAVGLWVSDNRLILFEFSIFHIGEVFLVASLLRRWSGPDFDFSSSANLKIFAPVALVVPWLVSLFSTPFILASHDGPLFAAITIRAAAHGLGYIIFTPAMMLLRPTQPLVLQPVRTRDAVVSGLLLVCGLGTVFGQSRYPLLFLALPPVVWLTFQFELTGAAVGILTTTVASIAASYAGRGPIALIHGSMTERILVLQVFLACCTLLVLPIAAALGERRGHLRAAQAARDEAMSAYASLGESEMRFRQAVESASNAIVMVDQDGLIEMVNAQAEQTFGYEHQDLIGQPIEMLIPERFPEGSHQGQPAHSRSFPADLQLFGVRKNGRRFPVEIGLNPVEIGGKTKLISSIVDIDDRKTAEDSVKQAMEQLESARLSIESSEASYRMLAENSPDIIIRSKPDGVINYCSPSVQALGYQPDEILGSTGHALLHPDDRSAAVERQAQYLSGAPIDTSIDRHYRLRAKDGSYRWFEGAPSVVKDEDGGIVEVINVLRDVTQRKRVESELLQAKAAAERAAKHANKARLAVVRSERMFRLLTQGVTDYAIYMLDPGGKVANWNAGAEQTKGYKADEILGRHFSCFYTAEDQASGLPAQALNQARSEGHFATEGWRVRKDGSLFWADVVIEAIFEDGKLIGFTKITRDATARKAMAEKLLASKVEAESVAQAQTDFLANMSHELRTPLTAIIGFSGLLAAKGKLGEMESMFVKRIGGASRSLLTLINDVLDISKVEAGQIEIENTPLGLRALAEDALQLLGEQAKAKGLDLKADIRSDLPDQVLGDPVRLTQIITNLVGNAIKFTVAGSVTLRIARLASGDIRFEVEDTGAGIPEDRVDKLFARFAQADSSTNRLHGGTGLGLAICKGLVELMGGEIGVQSVVGEGSTFWFRIPLPEVAKDYDASSPSPGGIAISQSAVSSR